MSYTPPICNLIDFDSSGAYTPPICSLLNFDIGGTAPHEILSADSNIFIEADIHNFFCGDVIQSNDAEIIIEAEESLLDLVWPIASDDSNIYIESDQHNIEILPDIMTEDAIVEVLFDVSHVRDTEPHHLPIDTSPGGINIIWGGNEKAEVHKSFPFGEGEDIYNHIKLPIKQEPKPDFSISMSWRSLGWKDNRISFPYADFGLQYNNNYCGSYINWMEFKDPSVHIPWGGGQEFIDGHFCSPHNEPGSHDTFKSILWDEIESRDWHFTVPWDTPGSHDIQKCIVWGPYSYYTLCYLGKYWPPTACYSISFNFPNKYALNPDVCSDLTFHLNSYSTDVNPRCPYLHWHTGIRDRYHGITTTPSNFPRAKEVYYMLNSVAVTEVVTGIPIEVLGITATIDRQSWLWQFQIVVASLDCLELIAPSATSLKSLLIQINGYNWICTVEGWNETRAFARDTWTITGRSPSMMFGDPMSLRSSNTITTNKQGEQLFNDVVTGKVAPDTLPSMFDTWTANWDIYYETIGGVDKVVTGFQPNTSWYVPSNTLSYTDKTEIEVMKSITGAIGAYVQTNADCRNAGCEFIVQPLYAQHPWNWNESNTGIEFRHIVDAQIIEVSRSYITKPRYQAVFVMGESIGGNNEGTGPGTNDAICARICHNNCSPSDPNTLYAPMITDRMVTSSKAGLERGRTQLCDSGEWAQHIIRMNILCPPPNESAGLFLPGDILAVMEKGTRWNGQVTGITVATANTGKAFTVNQTITVEEYLGGLPCE